MGTSSGAYELNHEALWNEIILRMLI